MNAKKIAIFVFMTGGLWSLWGISGIPQQGDQVGAFLFCIFVICIFKGRSPLVYLGAFFICTWLEIVGTASGTWKWAAIEPVFNWTQGNPPSGVAAWYCLVDAVAIGFAPKFLNGLQKMNNWYKTRLH